MKEHLATDADDLEVTPELVLLRIQTEVFLKLLGRKKAERFIRGVADRLETEGAYAAAIPLRPTKRDFELARSYRKAQAAFRSALPTYLAALRDGDT